MPTAACCRSSTSNASAPTASSKACSAWPGASAPARKNLDLAAFVRRFVVEYRQTLSMETDILEASIEGASVHALIDPKHLHQVLTALVHNALKYGRILDEPARVKLRVERRERMVAIDVIDRGPGIPETVAAQLFRPFYTTSEHGTGLGLYIARNCAAPTRRNWITSPSPAAARVPHPATGPEWAIRQVGEQSKSAQAGCPARAAIGSQSAAISARARPCGTERGRTSVAAPHAQHMTLQVQQRR